MSEEKGVLAQMLVLACYPPERWNALSLGLGLVQLAKVRAA